MKKVNWMNIISISALYDNYIWFLVDDQNRCIIIDPGEATSVLMFIKKNNLQPEAILLTHKHHDHVGGVSELINQLELSVYGPAETLGKGVTYVVNGGDNIIILGWNFYVFTTPGHTLGHLCYYIPPYLFCGDTFFSGGCGKLFEGTPAQMYKSLQKINALPDETIICCAHEYTLANMKFAKSILPDDPFIKNYYYKVKKLRAENKKTLPVVLRNERKVNLFLKINDIDLINKIHQEKIIQQPEMRFAWLRSKKDNF